MKAKTAVKTGTTVDQAVNTVALTYLLHILLSKYFATATKSVISKLVV